MNKKQLLCLLLYIVVDWIIKSCFKKLFLAEPSLERIVVKVSKSSLISRESCFFSRESCFSGNFLWTKSCFLMENGLKKKRNIVSAHHAFKKLFWHNILWFGISVRSKMFKEKMVKMGVFYMKMEFYRKNRPE